MQNILMRVCFLISTILLFSSPLLKAQKIDSSTQTKLIDVVIKAFNNNSKFINVPSGINLINATVLNRFNDNSIVQAINTTAGVKMEERSPGSYRLNIRGSSLRSPFGVRNIKVYYNNIPLTDPGGNTYLNQLGYYNFGSIEILKGPASSLYGAGTGGAMLIESNNIARSTGVIINYNAGSYGLQNSNINVNVGNDTFRNVINYQHQTSDGYREQSALRRDVLSWEANARIGDNDRLNATFLYGNLFYQTPGALTLAEYNSNPRAARPTVGTVPGAVRARAAIYQKTFLSGISYQKEFNSNWQNNSTVYATFSKLDNPTIRNYSRSNEPHFGGRTIFTYKKTYPNSEVTWNTGGEVQQGFTTVKIYKNKLGSVDTLQTDDDINLNTYFVFSQLSYLYNNWIATAGLSFNRSKIEFTRLSNLPSATQTLKFSNQLAPRVALLRKVSDKFSVYASWSKGFSPPTTAELFPTGSISNPNLKPEQGVNYEIGFKGYGLKNKLSFDINAFYFLLKNTIVQRRDVAGGDYYDNAGGTSQQGIESQLSYQLLSESNSLKYANVWLNNTYYNFYYRSFKQLSTDFSANRMPGVPRHAFAGGFDFSITAGLYAHLSYQYNDPVPLNDANTDYSDAYSILSCRFVYKHSYGKIKLNIFGGGDNLLDKRYSLGNDINGFGGRYYNAAARRNYSAGISIEYINRRKLN
jgi:iron complex outermembrane recepter protein